MKGTSHDDEGEDLEMLAAEYVLGVLEPSQRQRATRLLATNPGFSAQVETWKGHLAVLDVEFIAQQPPAKLKAIIEDRLFAATGPVRKRSAVSAFWRPLALTMTALFLLLGGLYAYDLSRLVPAAGDRLVAKLSADDSAFSLVVVVDPGLRELLVTPVVARIAEDRDLELWFISEGNAPVSMGLVASESPSRLPISPQTAGRILDGDMFALSVEPSGGSPTGQPTGPVVAAGRATKL